jgi:hypothetical protein
MEVMSSQALYIFIEVLSKPISGFLMLKRTFSALYILHPIWGNYPLFRRLEGITAIHIIIFLMLFFRIFRGFIQFTQSIQALILRGSCQAFEGSCIWG